MNAGGGFDENRRRGAMVTPISPSITAPPKRSDAEPAQRAEWLRELNSYLASAVCHLTALVVLGLLAAAVTQKDAGIKLQLQLGSGDDAIVGEEGAQAGQDNAGDTAADSLAAIEQEKVFDFRAITSPEVINVESPLESVVSASAPLDDADAAKQIDRTLARAIGRGGTGLGESGDGADAWSGKGSPWGREKGFFGIGDSGKSFVYVVDCSDSMNERGKFKRAKYELIRSLEELSPDQRFYVIFYSDGAYPMDADEPLPATEEEIARATEWITDVQATGGTNPLPALLYALTLKPDAIYFLSDGRFEPQTVLELRSRNRDDRRSGQSQVPIHTIAFGDRLAEGLMKSISRYSGGRYRFVK